MGLRVVSLIGRFALIIYITKFIGVAALAQYGFVVSAIAIFIAVSAIGMSPDLDRRLGRATHMSALLLLRDRLVTRIVVGALIYLFLIVIEFTTDWSGLGAITGPSIPVIIIGEAVFFDIQRAMILRSRPILSNVIYAYRSTAWVPFVILVGVQDPAFRTIDFVFTGWLIALSVCVIALLPLLTGASLAKLLSIPMRWSKRAYYGLRSWVLYFSNIGFVSTFYCDRFIVLSLCGINDAGVFIFIWSFINAAMSVIQVGYIQTALPKFSLAWTHKSVVYWRYMVSYELRSVLAASSAISLVGVVLLVVVLPALGYGYAREHLLLTSMMVAAAVVRSVADTLHQAVYSAEQDKAWLIANMLVVALSPPIGALAVWIFGLNGAGVVSLISATSLLGFRYRIYFRLVNYVP